MTHTHWRCTAGACLLTIGAGLLSPIAMADIPIADDPLFTSSGQPPLMMMVMSRDEQLFIKAYTDYTDLDGDGLLDTTYQNRFEYAGYFDPRLCYAYIGERFKAAGAAADHQCSNAWSGNFLNWLTMSRLDMLRFVFYGGYRSTDDTNTVLERAHIPSDLHAWVKTYSGSDIARYTPFTSPMSFCNASFSDAGAPKLRVATGIWTEWASTALNQCNWREDANSEAQSDSPPRATTEFVVRVEVCAAGASASRESFCRPYGANGATFKPAGLLQEYGENGAMRFGLLTGSYAAPRSGGVIRRNIGKIAGNSDNRGCSTGDEIDKATGRFCNQRPNDEGIINTMNRLKLTTWDYSSRWTDCNTYSILNRQGYGTINLNNPGSVTRSQNCSAWGNPVSEMYAEALRYIAAAPRTEAFATGTDLAGLPRPTWQDPYRLPRDGGNAYCANCSILVLSTGLNSFDSDEIPDVPELGSAATATNTVGGHEQITGDYLVGRVGATPKGESIATHEDLCTSKPVAALGEVRGICPDIPSMEGSYLLSGHAHKAFTTDLRPRLTTPSGQPKPASHKNRVQTYAVSVAENLPTFRVPVGNGHVSLAPLCQANNTGAATAESSGWRSCYLGAVGVGPKVSRVQPGHTYGRPLEPDGTAGSFSLVWEDSQWGNDHDNDVVSLMTYCVGSRCTRKGTPGQTYYDICWRSTSPACGPNGMPVVGEDEVLVRIENLSAYAGNAMLTGFAVTGSGATDGVKRLALRPGGANGSVLTSTAAPPVTWAPPQVLKFRAASGGARTLENPLFYAAKFGSFRDADNDNLPDPGEWDIQVPGKPDAFFPVRDPARLKTELRKVFEAIISDARPAASLATSSPRFVPGSTLTYQVSYKPGEWSGDVQAFRLNPNGTLGNKVWSADEKMPDAASRHLVTAVPNGAGGRFVGAPFSAATYATEPLRSELMGDLPVDQFALDDVVAYLRGDASKEVPAGPFRRRTHRIGDILSSTPAVVSRRSLGYAVLPERVGGVATGASSYRAFVESKSTQPVLFVGANDGMMHGFSGHDGGGVELFGYVPAGITGQLHHLARPAYSHRYYADASPLVGDAFLGGQWMEVLLSSIGIGGRGVYALNVSGLGQTGQFGPGNVLWEFNSQVDPDMGRLQERPQIALLPDGRWAAIFGNGYNSENHRSVLFIRDLASGDPIAKLDTGQGSPTDPNGMSGVAAADTDGDRVADTLYAGDYHGNLWKFILDSNNGWHNPLGSSPLFKAVDKYGHRQSITGGMDVVANPIGGTVVLFGTGRYLNTDDANPGQHEPDGNPLVNSIYGIWDSGPAAQSIQPSAQSRWELLRQQRVTDYRNGYRVSTQEPVGYRTAANPQGRFGWFLDLEYIDNGVDRMAAERVLAAPAVILGTALFNTFRPQGDSCQPGGLNGLMELDALSGGASYAEIPAGGTNPPPPRTGGTDIGNGPPQGEPVPVVSIQPPPAVPELGCDPNDPACSFTPPTISTTRCLWTYPNTANKAIQAPIPCGRVSWRQVH
ncbi:pilus assembly protein [Tahibacter amnicola]|uniref:PilC/PilY family type IV pilus protein n=1 Tax=Tahibacter amnicola TaxID=2976241 RepID=A0ABY6B8B3_9GAMM|nr:PilC/PilY family type IV pilus protein [Tahibacter amnicola]UXI66321.1 PilC/PilY family type IV pilus protein [Tahibacter amnicola]